MTTTLYGSPVNYQAADGSWQKIDPTYSVDPNGFLHPRSAPFDAQVAPFADDTNLLTVSYGHNEAATWSLRGATHAKGVVEDRTVTFAGALPDTDVVITDSTSGPAVDLVLHSAVAPGTVTFNLDLKGLTGNADGAGGELLLDASGAAVGHVTAPVVSDASGSIDAGASIVFGTSSAAIELGSAWLPAMWWWSEPTTLP